MVEANRSMYRRVRRMSEPWWDKASDDELLDLAFCDLGVEVAGSWVEASLERLEEDLARRELVFRPHVWFASEWFSPDGVPGVAIPFYLAHPRLMRLERKMMFDIEGGTRGEALAILRHEAGHAFDTAYRLRRRRAWREAFGLSSKPYRSEYAPNPNSQAYVEHLGWWYAQSHPVEDWAETFAVWLAPRSDWRRTYTGWKALRKLEAVDLMMREVGGLPPAVDSRERVDPIAHDRTTLRRHYAKRRRHYGVDRPTTYDVGLVQTFGVSAVGRTGRSAASFLRREAAELRRRAAACTGAHPYAVEQVLQDIIRRCESLGLRVMGSEERVRRASRLLLEGEVLALCSGRRIHVTR